MPTTVPGVLRFDLDSSLDTPADAWTAEVAGAALMLAPDDEALYQLPVGLLDATGNEVLAAQIAHGRILERRLVGRVEERRTYLRGVDALEQTFRIQRAIRYVPDPPTEPIDAAAAADEDITIKVGTWTASEIAADLVTGTGLTVSWGVRDYTFRETFDGTGPLYGLLQRLVEPWNQVAPLGVDITAVGTVIQIRPRLLHPPADLTMTVAESRLVELEVGPRRRLPYIGLVVLEGRPEGWQFLPGEPPIPEASVVVVPYSVPVYDLGGTLVSQVDGARTYREPDHLLLAHVQREYQNQVGGLMPTKEETTETTYEPSTYGPEGPLNQPLPLKAVKSIQTLVPITGAEPGAGGEKHLEETSREEITWEYDERRFLVSTLTQRFKRVNVAAAGDPVDFEFPETERIEEVRTEKLPGWVEVATTRTTYDPQTGVITGSVTLNGQDQAGFRPGGVRQPAAFASGGAPQPGRVSERISTDPTAVPIRYSNGNLTRDDLDFILEQYRAVSGLVEYPLRAQGPALPDVTKGSAIHLTEYVDADGTPIPLEPAQVRRIAFTYVDTRAAGEYSCQLEAVFYRDE